MAAPPISPRKPRPNNTVHALPPGSASGIAYKDSDAHALWAAVSVMLGILVGILGICAVRGCLTYCPA